MRAKHGSAKLGRLARTEQPGLCKRTHPRLTLCSTAQAALLCSYPTPARQLIYAASSAASFVASAPEDLVAGRCSKAASQPRCLGTCLACSSSNINETLCIVSIAQAWRSSGE